MIGAAYIEAIERATVAAVAPEHVDSLPGWLLPMDRGTISRGKSAVPLRHEAPDADPVNLLDAIEAAYRARGFQPMFRLADTPCFDAVREALTTRAYRAGVPVLVQTADVGHMRTVSAGVPADADPSPDAAWLALFLGPGFDAVDGASRSQSLSRAPDSVFASVRDGGRTLAVGAGAFSSGWASVHGMRTLQSHRGQGLAGRRVGGGSGGMCGGRQ